MQKRREGAGEEGGKREHQTFGFLINSVWPSFSFLKARPLTIISGEALYMETAAVVCEYTGVTELQRPKPHRHHHERVHEQKLLEGRSGRTGRNDPLHLPQHLGGHRQQEQQQPGPGGEGVADLRVGHRHAGSEFGSHQRSPPEPRGHLRDAGQLPDQLVQGGHVRRGPDAGLSSGQRHRVWGPSKHH